MTLEVTLLTMKLNSYLVQSRHGIFYLRIQRGGKEKRLSLRTRDPLKAQLAAYAFGGTIVSMNNNKNRTLGWTLATDGQKLELSTDGSQQDHANAIEALAAYFNAQAGHKSNISAGKISPSLSGKCLRDAVEEYGIALGKVKQAEKSKSMALSTLNKLTSKLGADFDLRNLSDDVVEKYWLQPRLTEVAATTAKRDLSFIRAFVEWSSDSKRMYCPAPLGLSLDAQGGHREYFSSSDLKTIFDALPGVANKPFKLWLPLIGLYTGARISEIAAVKTDGVYRKSSIDALFLPGTKTDASARLVPIHHDLVQLGLLDYATSRKVTGHEYLFDIKWSAVNGPGAEVSKWFGKFIRAVGISDKNKVFHSFRPTIVDHLRQHGSPFEPRCQYLGHDAGGGVHNKIYGREELGLSVLKAEVVDRIDWMKYCDWKPDYEALRAKALALNDA